MLHLPAILKGVNSGRWCVFKQLCRNMLKNKFDSTNTQRSPQRFGSVGNYCVTAHGVPSQLQTHDRLVDVEHLDPSSEEYYNQIEKQVAAAYPAKWNAFLHHHATRTARRPSVQQSPPSKGRRASFRFNDGNNGPNGRIGSPAKNRKPFVGMLNTVVGGSAMSAAAATAIAAGRIFGNINVNGAVGAGRQAPLSPHRGNLTAQRQGRRDPSGAQPTFASSSLHSPYSLTNTGNSPPASTARPIANLHLHKQHAVPIGLGTLSPRSSHHSIANQQTSVLTNRSTAAYPSLTSTPATSSPNTPAHPHATAAQSSQRQGSATSIASNASFAHPVNPFNLTADASDSDRYPSHTTITAEADDSGGLADEDSTGQDAAGAASFQAVWNNGDYFAGSAGQTLIGGIRGEGFGITGWENGGTEMISAQAMQVSLGSPPSSNANKPGLHGIQLHNQALHGSYKLCLKSSDNHYEQSAASYV